MTHQIWEGNCPLPETDQVGDCGADGGGHDGDNGDGDNDNSGDDERQEVSVTRCWLSLAVCLTGCF